MWLLLEIALLVILSLLLQSLGPTAWSFALVATTAMSVAFVCAHSIAKRTESPRTAR